MNEDSDCYYQPKPLAAELAGNLNCRSVAQDYYSKKRSLADLNAGMWAHYLQMAASQHSAKRVKPPVPKFEETQKKIKLNTNGPEDHMVSTNNVNPMKVKVIKVVPEACSFKELVSSNSKKSKAQEKMQAQLDRTMSQAEPVIVKIEENSEEEKSFLHDSPPTSGLNSPPTAHLSSEPLDKKDEKKFQKFVECLNLYVERLSISNASVTEKFKELARCVIPKLLSHFKSKPFEAVAAAILLHSCREVDYPIPLKQIVAASEAKEKLINKCIFSLKEILPSNGEVKHFKAGEFIKVLAEKLNLSEIVKSAAIKIWENIEKLNFIKSIHAVTLAACCLKFSSSLSEEDRDFEAIAVAAGITKMTLKNMYRELFPYRFYFITADCMLRDPKELKKL